MFVVIRDVLPDHERLTCAISHLRDRHRTVNSVPEENPPASHIAVTIPIGPRYRPRAGFLVNAALIRRGSVVVVFAAFELAEKGIVQDAFVAGESDITSNPLILDIR